MFSLLAQDTTPDAGFNSEYGYYFFENYLLPAIVLLLVVIIAYLIGCWLGRLTTSASRKAKLDETLARFFGKIVKYAVVIAVVVGCLQKVGVSVAPFAAIIAAMGFAIGLAFQGTLGNFSAGVMLLIFRPFKVGDVVNVAGVTAKVYEIELFTTTLDTPDNRRMIVPNSAVFGTTIENITFHDTRRVDVAVGCDYTADMDKTRDVLLTAAKAVQGVLNDPEPAIVLSELGDSSINWQVRVWSATADYWAVRDALTREVKIKLDEANIGIPFPQMDVHVDKE